MSERRSNGDRGLAEDLEHLVDGPASSAPAPPWSELGALVLEAEALWGDGALTAAAYAEIRRRAVALLSTQPTAIRQELLAALEDLDPDGRVVE